MNSSRFLKKVACSILSFACGMNFSYAQVSNYSADTATALSTCQAQKNCTREQKAQIDQYTRDANTADMRAQTQMCNGRACTASELNAMAAQQTKEVSQENAAAYANGANAATTGTLTTPTYSTNTAANNSGTSASSGNNGMIVMVASAGAAVATATVLKKPCMSAFSSAWACPLMAVALVQVGASLLSSKGSGSSRDALTGSGVALGENGSSTAPTTLGLAGNTAAGTDNSYGGNVKLASEAGQIAAAAEKLSNEMKGTGYEVSPDGGTVKGPNGKSISTSAFSSPQAMKDAGFSDSQISDMQAAMDAAGQAANDKFKKIAALTNDVGGGGGKGGGSGSENGGSGGGYGGGYGFDADKLLGKKSKVKNAVAGMSKKLGDDNIGVAGDNIFEMISRRYQVRDQQNNFIVDQK